MDGLHNPKPNKAPSKSTVAAVLKTVGRKGVSAIRLLAGLLAAVLMLFSVYVLYDSFYTEKQAFSAWDVLQYKPEIATDGASPLSGESKLAAINKDYRSWLTMYETNIDYPVMQGKNDLYYASHDVYGDTSLTGAIYLAADNTADLSDAYNLIYGHHMDNGAMFGGLDKYLDKSYAESHKYGVLVTPTKVYDLEVFAVADTDAYEEKIMSVGPGRTASDVIGYLKNPSKPTVVKYFDAKAAEGATKITAMSTCASAATNGRLVVFCVTTLRNLITVEIPSYDGIYDGLTHTVKATPSYKDGTVIEYSTDGGKTWTTELPSIKNVGTVEVIVRAVSENYGRATATATLTVRPAPVTVTAVNAGKLYGAADPAFNAVVEGVIDGQTIVYIVTRPGAGVDEAVGTYYGAIVPSGEQYQGNYVITYVPADFTIEDSGMYIGARGYTGVYDGQPHYPTVNVSPAEGTTVEYSTDGGKTWTTEMPSITNVGEIHVLIRATNPAFDTVTAEVVLKITPRKVVVTAKSASKTEGDDDPEFEYTIEGVIDGFKIIFKITRKGGEEPGVYEGAIVPEGEEYQGNYVVEYVPADFTITPKKVTPVGPVEPEPETHHPSGGRGDAAWALVNLLCVIFTVYLLIPLLHLRDKFGRSKLMKKINGEKNGLREAEELAEIDEAEKTDINRFAAEVRAWNQDGATEETVAAAVAASEAIGFADVTEEEYGEAVDSLYYRVKKFLRRLRGGVIGEIITAIGAIVAFILTEDMRNPMILIDRWTPLMIAILLVAWIIDVRLARYREGVLSEEREEEAEEDKDENKPE